MEINPTGPNGVPPVSTSEEPLNSVAATPAETPESAPSGAGQALSALTARFQKADLQDPVKVEKMLSFCAGDLLQAALGRVKGQVPESGSQYLADWLQNDPTIRAKLLNYLERVLT